MALTRHRRMRANPVELLVVNPGRPGMTSRHNPEWARRVGGGLYRGSRYAAESARDLYHGAREAHRAHRAAAGAAAPTKNPGRKPKKKRKNPVAKPKRDRSGRFVPKARAKRKSKKKASKKRARRGMRTVVVVKARANPAAAKRRRRRAKLKSNPVRRRRRHMAENPAAPKRRKRRNPRRRHAHKNPLSKRFQKRARRTVAVLKKRAKKAPKRSIRRRALSAQVRRAGAISSLARSRASAKRIRPAIRGLQKAMLTRNPSLEGVMVAAKALAIPAVVSTTSLVGLAMAGKWLADCFTTKDGVTTDAYKDKDTNKLTKTAQYAPAAATAAMSGLAFIVANRIMPQYRGAILLGGLSAAILQAIMASDEPVVALPKEAPFLDKAKQALALSSGPIVVTPSVPAAPAAPGTEGFGEYTTVGSGIFHGFGEYTTVGGGGDNSTEFAADSLRGLDDASHFAPGEGGVLSGGIFK